MLFGRVTLAVVLMAIRMKLLSTSTPQATNPSGSGTPTHPLLEAFGSCLEVDGHGLQSSLEPDVV